MSRPLLKLGGDSGDILRDVLRLPGVSEAETVISGAEGRDELRHICMSLQAPEPFGCFEHTRGDPAQHHLRHRVLFTRAADLVRDLREARDERTLRLMQQRLQRVELLVIDELGFVPFDRVGGALLFNVFADRYERRSTLITTNLAFSEWVKVFGDEKMTLALLDRLGQRAHILTTKGRSYRTRKQLTQAPKRA